MPNFELGYSCCLPSVVENEEKNPFLEMSTICLVPYVQNAGMVIQVADQPFGQHPCFKCSRGNIATQSPGWRATNLFEVPYQK